MFCFGHMNLINLLLEKENFGSLNSGLMKLGDVMKKIVIILILILVACSGMAIAEDNKIFDHFNEKFLVEKTLLLNLKHKSDTTAIKEIKFYGNRIDPNRTSIRDRFSISVNNKFIEVPESVFKRLHNLRRSFSYDKLSGGVLKAPNSEFRCMMLAPAEGLVLEVLYLTTALKTSEIIKSEMKPVFGLALNCLFTDFYKPVLPSAQNDARAVLEILNTIGLIYGK